MFWKKKQEGGGKVVIFFASDLHGSNVCFRKFLNAVDFYGANVLVMGGDMTGKAMMPIAEQADGTWLAFSAGETIRLMTKAEVDDFIKRTGNQGFYPVMVTEAEYRELSEHEERRHELFKRLVVERVREWCAIAEQKLHGRDVPLITAPGNDDFFEIDPVLHASPAIQYHEMEVTTLHGHEVLHCGGSTRTPWNTEREFTEDQYRERLSHLCAQVKDMSRCIFNVHVPPHGTILDQCPKLDENLRVVFEMGQPVPMHAGSIELYKAIEQHQPLLGIHGHIHEGRGQIKIGRTVCINPGSTYPEGLLQGALVTLQDGGIKSVNLTQG
jgi:Icc-related predicted phosphoesterase